MFLALATLFKFTAAPLAITIILIVLFVGDRLRGQRVSNLLLIGFVGGLSVIGPVIYAALYGGGFSIALNWLGALHGSGSTFGLNIERL